MANNSEYNNEALFRQALRLIEQNKLHRLEPLLEDIHPADIANLITALPESKRQDIWSFTPDSKHGEVLNELDDKIRASLLDEMNTAEVVDALNTLIEDEQADLIQDIPDRTEEILQAMDEDRRRRLERVLYYPEDAAGGLMDVDTVAVRADVSVRTVFRYLRQLGELPESTNKLFVVDRQGRYRGQVLIINILTASENDNIEDLLSTDAEAILATQTVKEVSEKFTKLNLISAAVVDEQNHLLGRITVDDVVDYIQDSNQDSLMKMTGTTQEDALSPIIKSSRLRTVWLGINLLTALIASWVIVNFEEVIGQMVALAVLMPVVASMGGIAGTQTLSLVIRSIALGQLRPGNQSWLLRKEIGVGLLNGIIWALIIGGVTQIWFHENILSVIIAAAILINLTVATSSGVIIPVMMDRLGIDPAISSGVILTTITDVVGFLSFLGLASLLI